MYVAYTIIINEPIELIMYKTTDPKEIGTHPESFFHESPWVL